MPSTIRPLTVVDKPFLWDMLYEAIFVPPGRPTPNLVTLLCPRALTRRIQPCAFTSGWDL